MVHTSEHDIEVLERWLIFWSKDLLGEETENCGAASR